MSFLEDVALHREALLRLVDADVPVVVAARALGISRARAYEMLRASGHRGRARMVVTAEQRERVLTAFAGLASLSGAARVAGLSTATARRILVEAGVVPATATRPAGAKPEAKARFAELVASGASITRAAREVGVNPRTGRDWARGVRKSHNRRAYADGTVVDSDTRACQENCVSA